MRKLEELCAEGFGIALAYRDGSFVVQVQHAKQGASGKGDGSTLTEALRNAVDDINYRPEVMESSKALVKGEPTVKTTTGTNVSPQKQQDDCLLCALSDERCIVHALMDLKR